MITTSQHIAKLSRAQSNPDELAVCHLATQLEIALMNAAEKGQTSIVFVVPAIIPGFPSFDLDVIVKRLQKQLTGGGYIVRINQMMHMHVSWDHETRRIGDLLVNRR